MADRPFIHPDRKRRGIRPFTAMRRMNQLVTDPENTKLVFDIVDALNGDNLRKDLQRFRNSEHGPRHLAERVELPTLMDDHARWKALPDGTVGRAYVDFMEREGLSAKGLVDESLKHQRPRFDDDYEWYSDRLRDTHDLYHVLTGYGRDRLGEAALLGFTWGQHKGRGALFISYMGCRTIRKYAPDHLDIMVCYREGKANGRAAKRIVDQDILKVMEEPIDTVRQRLNIRPPSAYLNAKSQLEKFHSMREELEAA